MYLHLNNRVENKSGTPGTVIAVDDLMAQIQFDHGGKAGWFSRRDDSRLSYAH